MPSFDISPRDKWERLAYTRTFAKEVFNDAISPKEKSPFESASLNSCHVFLINFSLFSIPLKSNICPKTSIPLTSIPLPANTQNGRVTGLVVIRFRFPKITPKCLTSNPRLQPDTHFAVDMFPYKKTELFQKSGFKSKLPKKAQKYAAFWHLFIFP